MHIWKTQLFTATPAWYADHQHRLLGLGHGKCFELLLHGRRAYTPFLTCYSGCKDWAQTVFRPIVIALPLCHRIVPKLTCTSRKHAACTAFNHLLVAPGLTMHCRPDVSCFASSLANTVATTHRQLHSQPTMLMYTAFCIWQFCSQSCAYICEQACWAVCQVAMLNINCPQLGYHQS